MKADNDFIMAGFPVLRGDPSPGSGVTKITRVRGPDLTRPPERAKISTP
jgi:hypothetical protein